MYYRVAIQGDASPLWKWKSTVLSSLNALFQFLRLYRVLPQDRLRVFSSSTYEDIDWQLMQENNGLCSNSVTAAQFLQERLMDSPQPPCRVPESGTRENREMATTMVAAIAPIAPIAAIPSLHESNRRADVLDERGLSSLDRRRSMLERGAGGDHDMPYIFTLPTSTPQLLAWMRLFAKVQNGTLQS